ncbi:MAG: 3-deoxy-7-phosphoheptulonate synthase [Treponema porcinum]|uniref:3-deoxy-7-phosphoheptulonate synthase n=2 Tax=Treponema porcinum TaxID=261392 RepID=UPI00235445AD|nr:3-deoxy-7-phosphoheptulonate synthase [Treponema porcinum]MCI6322478.1 3-deoxy-7-phosphoheptulonate synthase [Treponema porcinum]MCI6983304.1 3-deoxy-7-phosphoheptulonate synthase [Treponema porcinum]MCI7545431.1 3-deoxy-7-phosphoheptulonate synthase [Treponema porcinum]MDY4189460.1 3-deoxy-7-phosphoheptulonate synthase [Treponema porcinum]MDY5048076.1 3-deoxy-7-phosphoheptulonate synthase [Treponema porcinum]
MIIVLKKNAEKKDVERFTGEIKSRGFGIHLSEGTDKTIIGLLGDTSKLDPEDFLANEIVESAERVSAPYKMASRSFHPENTVVTVGGGQSGIIPCCIGDGKTVPLLAGPCSVESEEQIISAARAVKKAGARILRGGAYKPRTSPYSFQGLGAEGIRLLEKAKKETGLPVCTELMSVTELEYFDNVDLIQVGARNFQNFDLLKELGKSNKPVLLKRGLSGTINELLMSAEYIMANGNENVILCERGIRTYDNYTRNCLDVSAVPYLHKVSHLPVVIDPSHACGIRWMVPVLAQCAVAAGADGLEIEVHCNPEKAMSDASQQLTPQQFEELTAKLNKYAAVEGKSI